MGEEEAASSVLHNVRAWKEVWSESDGKKQRVIMAALVSSFDHESHEAAMSRRFFMLLKELDYPEIRELARCVRAGTDGREVSFSATFEESDGIPGDEGSTHRARLGDLGLLRVSNARHWGLTWLGVQLVEFLERGGYTPSSSTEHDDEQEQVKLG